MIKGTRFNYDKTENTKVCLTCGKEKPLNLFYKEHRKWWTKKGWKEAVYIRSYCAKCYIEKENRKYQEKRQKEKN